jgi:hypothetical protein
MKMIKSIVFILALMLSGIIGCLAVESGNLALNDGLRTKSLDIGDISEEEITDGLRHATCTLHLSENKRKDAWNYIEGAICPANGGECTYSAIMKLNGKITILKQISSGDNHSEYKSNDVSITIKQTPMTESNDDEGSDVKATIAIKLKNEEKTLNMIGYCGV